MASKKISSKTKTIPPKSKSATAKTAVKTARAKVRGAIAPAKKLKPASSPAWPQAMSAGGAVVAHAMGKAAKGASVDGKAHAPAPELKLGHHRNGSPARSGTVAPWFAPWGLMSKAAMDRQFEIYQTMARFSPLTLALQMVQGLLPTDPRPAQPGSARRQ